MPTFKKFSFLALAVTFLNVHRKFYFHEKKEKMYACRKFSYTKDCNIN